MILHTNRKEMKQLIRSLELYIPLVIELCSVKIGKAQELKFEIAKYQGIGEKAHRKTRRKMIGCARSQSHSVCQFFTMVRGLY